MDDLHLMPKLKQHIDAVNAFGGKVKICKLGPGVCAGRAQSPDKVIINNWYIRGMVPDYSENRMIVVLYHELGHIAYFKGLGGRSADDAESEFQAFKNSLVECRKLAQGGDKGPLRTALHFIGQRQTSGHEPAYYQTALDRIVVDSLWGESQADAQ
jgi:hypothetical protein